LMIVVVVMIALPTRWSFYESDNNTAQGLLWLYMDGIQSRRAQTFFLTVSNILCVNNWNDSLGKWGVFFSTKGDTHNARTLTSWCWTLFTAFYTRFTSVSSPERRAAPPRNPANSYNILPPPSLFLLLLAEA
jgi:hypothetical protein